MPVLHLQAIVATQVGDDSPLTSSLLQGGGNQGEFYFHENIFDPYSHSLQGSHLYMDTIRPKYLINGKKRLSCFIHPSIFYHLIFCNLLA